MKAIELIGYGDVDQLVYRDVPMPDPAPGEVLVKVIATSVNPIDWKLRKGALKERMPLQFPTILGRDLAGEVVNTGRKIMGLVSKSYADYLVAKEETLAAIPEGLAIEEAGALPLVLLTGSQLVEKGMNVTSGQTVLVTGALGGVGRTAVFVAKQHGARVIAGVRGKQKAAAAELGADQIVAIDSDEEIQGLPELDGIADTVGGETIYKLLPKLKAGSVLGAVTAPPKGLEQYQVRLGSITAQPDPSRLNKLARAVVDGKFKIPIAKRFSLKDAGTAQKTAESGGSGGKILIIP